MTWWVDRSARIDGTVTAWREAGSGDPLVFLHGLGGTREAWNPQLMAFSDRHRCIAWDMPGYGDSDGEPDLTYETIADRLAALIRHLGYRQVDLIGLSFGGMHALHTALHHPDLVGRLVLADTSPAFGMDGTTPEAWKASRLSAIEEGETPASIAPQVLDSIVASPLDPEIRAQLIGAFSRIPVDGFRSAVECLPHNDIRPDLQRITNEALVIVGELDTETPVAYARTLADGLPSARLVILPGVGHLAPSESPKLFNQQVLGFLTSTHPISGSSS
ncbi:MAG: alpha/beta fold hydrolase [Acidimicrobiales bacterium]